MIDPISESYLVLRSEQEIMPVDKTLFSEEAGAFIRAGAFTRINAGF